MRLVSRYIVTGIGGVAILAAILVSGCGGGTDDPNPEDIALAIYDAKHAGDIEATAELYSPSIIVVGDPCVFRYGRDCEGIDEWLPINDGAIRNNWRVTPIEIETDGNTVRVEVEWTSDQLQLAGFPLLRGTHVFEVVDGLITRLEFVLDLSDPTTAAYGAWIEENSPSGTSQ